MIPKWNSSGILPPIKPEQPGHSPDRSPYKVSMKEFVERFAFSESRLLILERLLDYRRALSTAGIKDGFQWIDGSFVEKIEDIEDSNPALFDREHLKKNYLVDGYYQTLGGQLHSYNVESISYWYSMWSHRRNGIWKGFVQVALSHDIDDTARKYIESKSREGAWS